MVPPGHWVTSGVLSWLLAVFARAGVHRPTPVARSRNVIAQCFQEDRQPPIRTESSRRSAAQRMVLSLFASGALKRTTSATEATAVRRGERMPSGRRWSDRSVERVGSEPACRKAPVFEFSERRKVGRKRVVRYSQDFGFSKRFVFNCLGWRRGWDSNPRAGYPTRRFRGAPVTTTSVPLRLLALAAAPLRRFPPPLT